MKLVDTGSGRDLVEQVDLGDGIGRVARVLDEQPDEAHERVERVEAFGADQRRAVRLLPERAVTQVDAHLRTEAEEARDEVVRLQDSLLVHLRTRDSPSTTTFLLEPRSCLFFALQVQAQTSVYGTDCVKR